MRRDLAAIRASHFDLTPVTEFSSIKGISFAIEQKERLKEIGALSQCPDWKYGYFRSNENNAKVNNKLYAVDKLLANILDFITDSRIVRKIEFSEAEKNMFELIIGSNQDSRLVTMLKGGADYA